MRMPRQNLCSRHRNGGSQVKPLSSITIFSFGWRANTPSTIRLVSWVWNACAWAT